MNKWFEDNNAKQTADFEEGRKKMYNKHGVISIFNLNEKIRKISSFPPYTTHLLHYLEN